MTKKTKKTKTGRPSETDEPLLRRSVAMSDSMMERLEAFASDHGVSSAWVIRKAVIEFLDRHEAKGIFR